MFFRRRTVASRSNKLACKLLVRPSDRTCKRCIPFGLNLTTLTGAECLLSVDRYSTRGFFFALPSSPGVMNSGCTIHSCSSPISNLFVGAQLVHIDILGRSSRHRQWQGGSSKAQHLWTAPQYEACAGTLGLVGSRTSLPACYHAI